MTSNLKMALSAAALVAGLAATPALAQFAAGHAGGAVGGGIAVQGGGAAAGGGGYGAGHVGAPIAPPAAPMPAPQVYTAPPVNPQAHVPQVRVPPVAPGGGYGAPRVRNPGGPPVVQGSPWNGGIAHAPRQPRGPDIGVARPFPPQALRHGHRGHRGYWRGRVWQPYYLGGYDYAYGVYDDDDYCVLRKVRVHTRHGWRRVWRRVCV